MSFSLALVACITGRFLGFLPSLSAAQRPAERRMMGAPTRHDLKKKPHRRFSAPQLAYVTPLWMCKPPRYTGRAHGTDTREPLTRARRVGLCATADQSARLTKRILQSHVCVFFFPQKHHSSGRYLPPPLYACDDITGVPPSFSDVTSAGAFT